MYNNIFISSSFSNMYVGYWNSNIFYKKGEIVYVEQLKEYFIYARMNRCFVANCHNAKIYYVNVPERYK